MTIKTKRRFVSALKTFNVIGIVALIILAFVTLGSIKDQAVRNHDDLEVAVKQIEKDHDRQNRYLQCLVNLFISTQEDTVTQEQSAFCLAQVRAGTTRTNTIQPTPQNGDTTTTTTTTQSSPRDNPQQAPEKAQTNPTPPAPTTSEPPEPTPEPTPEPSLTERVVNSVKGLVGL